MPITIEFHEQDDATLVITLIGSAGVPEGEELDHNLLAPTARRPKRTIFDMTQLDFVSSLAMGTLSAYRNAMVTHGCEVRFVGISTRVRKAVDRAALDKVWDMRDTLEEATA